MFAKGIFVLKLAEIFFSILCQSMAQLEEWKIPCDAIYEPKNCENASLDTLYDVEDYERCAPARLDPILRNYVWGASGKGITFLQNKEAYKRIWMKSTVLPGHANYSMETIVFGRKIGIPIGISPTAGQYFYHPDGDLGTARGAASVGAVMILSMYSVTSLEDVALTVPEDAELWMHIYVLPNRQWTADIVRRAEKAGYKAIVVTVDQLYSYDFRCNAKRAAMEYANRKKHPHLLSFKVDDIINGLTLSFKDISWLSGISKLPVVVKGILTAEDAIKSIAAGASAIFVSNQGGRALDGALPTIDALPSIVRAVKSQYPWVPVFVDGGIRSGHDVFKALARGATMAFIGRPAIWGLTMGGEKGIEKVLTILREEFKNALIHSGSSHPSQITSSSIISEWIYSDFHQGEMSMQHDSYFFKTKAKCDG